MRDKEDVYLISKLEKDRQFYISMDRSIIKRLREARGRSSI